MLFKCIRYKRYFTRFTIIFIFLVFYYRSSKESRPSNESRMISIFYSNKKLYLEAYLPQNFIKMNETDTVTIECKINGTFIKKSIKLVKHLSYQNNIRVMRVILVDSFIVPPMDSDYFLLEYSCNLRHNSSLLFIYNKENRKICHYFPKNNQTMNNYMRFFSSINLPYHVTELKVGSTLNGLYNWSNEDLEVIDAKSQKQIDAIYLEHATNKKYKKYIRNKIGEQKVYLTLSTNPERIKKIHFVLKQIDFSHIDAVFLNLPELFKGSEGYIIPFKLLHRFPKIKILSISYDIGPLSKILPSVEYVKAVRGKKADLDMFISIDDDSAYASSMVSTLLYKSLRCANANCIVAGCGANLSHWFLPRFGWPMFKTNENKLIPVNIVEGFGGVCYRGKHLDIESFKSVIINKKEVFLACYLSDDILLSFFIAYNGFELGVLPQTKDLRVYSRRKRRDFAYFEDKYALHMRDTNENHLVIKNKYNENDSNSKKYNVCFQKLVENFVNFTSPNFKFKPIR